MHNNLLCKSYMPIILNSYGMQVSAVGSVGQLHHVISREEYFNSGGFQSMQSGRVYVLSGYCLIHFLILFSAAVKETS